MAEVAPGQLLVEDRQRVHLELHLAPVVVEGAQAAAAEAARQRHAQHEPHDGERAQRRGALDPVAEVAQAAGDEAARFLDGAGVEEAVGELDAQPGAAHVIGVDFAGAMLSVARKKLARERRRDRVALVRGDATRLPVATASVDAVTIAFGIRNVDRLDQACAEMRRVLKVGGRLAVLEFAVPALPVWRECYGWYVRHLVPRIGRVVSHDDGAYGYLPASIDAFATPDELVKILRQAGFVDVSTVRLTLGSVCLYVGRRGP